MIKALICTGIFYLSFMLGYNWCNYDVNRIIDHCASKLPEQDMGSFYKMESNGDPRTFYPHAEAFTEMNWAKCFRKEFNK